MARILADGNSVLALLRPRRCCRRRNRADRGGARRRAHGPARGRLPQRPRPPAPPLHWPADGLRRLLAAVEASRDEGLHPADYRHDALADAVEAGRVGRRDRRARDRLGAPPGARLCRRPCPQPRAFDWHIAHSPAALASLDADLRKAVEGGTLDTYLRGLLPQDARYVALRDALRDTPPGETQRITHIRASMERWRWMPRVLGDDYVWVNVPTYPLALMHGDSVAATHVVVVGAPRRRRRCCRPTSAR